MQAVARSSRDILEARDRHVPRGIVTAHPVAVERAEGSELWDTEGRRYLDFVGGIGVLNVGHSHPRVVEAVAAQARKVSHVAFQVAAYRAVRRARGASERARRRRRPMQDGLPDYRS